MLSWPEAGTMAQIDFHIKTRIKLSHREIESWCETIDSESIKNILWPVFEPSKDQQTYTASTDAGM